MDVGLSDCQAPKRAIPSQEVCSVKVPQSSSAALALWCLLLTGVNCVSP